MTTYKVGCISGASGFLGYLDQPGPQASFHNIGWAYADLAEAVCDADHLWQGTGHLPGMIVYVLSSDHPADVWRNGAPTSYWPGPNVLKAPGKILNLPKVVNPPRPPTYPFTSEVPGVGTITFTVPWKVDAYLCKACNGHYSCVEPNQPDGSYVCYACR